MARQLEPLGLAEGTQINGRQGRTLGRLAPALVERIGIAARSQNQERRHLTHRRRGQGEVGQGAAIGPVQVLDHYQERPVGGQRRHQGAHGGHALPVARGEVHGRQQGGQVGRLGQAQQIVEVEALGRFAKARGHGPLGGPAALLEVGVVGQAEQ